MKSYLLTSTLSNFNVLLLIFILYKKLIFYSVNILLACIFFHFLYLFLFLLLTSFYTYLLLILLKLPVFKIMFSSFFFTTTLMIFVFFFLQQFLSIKPIKTHYMNKKTNNKLPLTIHNPTTIKFA